MPHITIDGVDYVPATSEGGAPRFGVAITTRNRPDKLARTVEKFRQLSPPGTPVIVVDDASDVAPPSDFRFPVNVGIATAKNKCIELLLAAGVDHLFLCDDDAFPLVEAWWRPYVESPERHLFAVFATPTNKSSRIEALYRDDRHVAYHATRGYFLYLHRSVVDRVGGFDARFRNAFEHVEYSNRIHNAGLTTWPYQDVVGSEKLIFCDDSRPGNRSAIVESTRRANEELGRRLLVECEGRSDFVAFGTRDVVLSCLFVGQPDPQRGQHLRADPTLASKLLGSLPGVDVVVLCDFAAQHPNFVRVPGGLSPYIQRWVSYRRYLVEHPEVRWVWCVDATDVVSQGDPFGGMRAGVLYAGWENQVVGCDWMLSNHMASRAWVEANADRALLNAGVAGGDRATVLELCSRIIGLWSQSVVAKKSDAAGDMAFFNQAAYSMNVETGPRVTTVFKADQGNDWSKWKHK